MPIKTIKSNNIPGLQWLCCPNCGAKTNIGIYSQTTLVFFPLYCSKCKTETLISGTNCFMLLSKDIVSSEERNNQEKIQNKDKPESGNTD